MLGWAVAVANARAGPPRCSPRSAGPGWYSVTVLGRGLVAAGGRAHRVLSGADHAGTAIRASLTLGDPNLAANYFLVGLLVLRAARCPRRRASVALRCAVIVTAICLTGSNGGALAALVVATVLGGLFRLARRPGCGGRLLIGGVRLSRVAAGVGHARSTCRGSCSRPRQ